MKRMFGVILFGALSVLVVVTGLSQPKNPSAGSLEHMANPPSEAASSRSAPASAAE